jgi:hypothetical protein
MIRQAIRGVVALAAVALVLEAVRAQQPTAADKVSVREKDKKDGSVRTIDGKLTLRPAGLQVLSADGKTVLATLSFGDIVKIVPGDLAGVERGAMLGALANEDKKTRKDYEAAHVTYKDLKQKAGTGAPEATKRHLEYRLALMTTRIADESGDDEKWHEQAEAAVKEWSGFLTGYKSGWEVWHAARTSARLYAELNKFDEAAKMWSRIATNPELPPDLKLEASIQEIDAQFRSQSYSNAAAGAAALLKTAGPGSAKEKLAIYEHAARAAEGGLKADTVQPVADAIRKKIAETKDPAVRGVGYGVLGELYLLANRPREAMWEFLAVETLYNADKDEVMKAMCRLVVAFKAQMDEDYEKRYREKIRRFRATF